MCYEYQDFKWYFESLIALTIPFQSALFVYNKVNFKDARQ